MFLLITFQFAKLVKISVISIHPMFLLIHKVLEYYPIEWYFNTSHVSINQDMDITTRYIKIHFNTSHVSINRRRKGGFMWSTSISIHPMFLLILIHFFTLIFQKNFNTSHVSINHKMREYLAHQNNNFNTSHVSINQFPYS